MVDCETDIIDEMVDQKKKEEMDNLSVSQSTISSSLISSTISSHQPSSSLVYVALGWQDHL